MTTEAKDELAHAFSVRLRTCLRERGINEGGTALARAFNFRSTGRPISLHAARKWLVGESFPTQDKIVVLAEWFEVSSEWLRFGGAPTSTWAKRTTDRGARKSLLSDIEILTQRECTLVRALIDAMLKARSSPQIKE